MPAKPEELRASIRGLVRRLGILNTDRMAAGATFGASYCHALTALLESDELLMQRDLAQILNLNKSSITRLCRRLEEAEHIEIGAHAIDGRARIISLTQSGEKLARDFQSASRARFATLLAKIPAEEHAKVMQSLQLLNEALATLDKVPPHSLP